MVCSLITLIPDDKGFKKVCDYLESTIVKENLSINGGTLNHHSLTYNSDVLLVAVVENIIIGYASLVKIQNTCYVYQIALSFPQFSVLQSIVERLYTFFCPFYRWNGQFLPLVENCLFFFSL
jgi:hypothetical protein